jgi:hypothetical protein
LLAPFEYVFENKVCGPTVVVHPGIVNSRTFPAEHSSSTEPEALNIYAQPFVSTGTLMKPKAVQLVYVGDSVIEVVVFELEVPDNFSEEQVRVPALVVKVWLSIFSPDTVAGAKVK